MFGLFFLCLILETEWFFCFGFNNWFYIKGHGLTLIVYYLRDFNIVDKLA